jgi:outer membrane protein assembly factor BamB
VAIQWALKLLLPVIAPDYAALSILSGIVGAGLLLVWWIFFSRASRLERLAVPILIVACVTGTLPFLDKSVATGMMRMMFPIVSAPFWSLGLVLAAVLARALEPSRRLATIALAILLSCAGWTSVRTEGVKGEGGPQLAWRWTKTHEETLLARAPLPTPLPSPAAPKPVPPKAEPVATIAEPPAWPGFRGPNRDSVVHATSIRTDWTANPPAELWRRPVGPGWSSFAAGSELIYTQEQRGDSELVSCYKLSTGEPVWTHTDHTRFWESNAGAGPRGTPTLDNGRVYSLGATGIVNGLDASTGSLLWTHDAAADTGAKTPTWGFSSSPLVTAGLVIVAAGPHLIAYDVATGEKRWKLAGSAGSYSSPQLLSIGGVPQIVFLDGEQATSVSPFSGTVFWRHSWSGAKMLQPAAGPDGSLLIATADMSGGAGIRNLRLARLASNWNVTERWTSTGLKPYFNDFVVHRNQAFGFDGAILASISLEDGRRKWKGGRYGHGQLLLLAGQDLMLVLSEDGELALVAASPDNFQELARFKAIEGKTWNHPALVGDTLLVRNGEEMAAFRLPR